MLIIDSRSSTPIYEQIIIGVKELILKGIVKPGDKLPSIRELSTILTINPNTVSKAYGELESDNIVETIKGKGTFVSDKYEKKASEDKKSKLIIDIKRLILEANYLGIEENDLILLLSEGFKEIRGGI
ncbi:MULTISPECIES: GntR family transcriptional regulator [Clostridium]|jgi:GntR family transcriptional regulator|uniref:GntR family transcriptional regulator n=1 Tax=Clostridium sartagoforme AAU1 TaxID=1202534 RepID=R9C5S5_9CLOT|nr:MULTISPECIES: GntR family transcriptional regulator [Clostridium]EOR24638.1 GntR family transcriptional regulator [Clostridium sartagoforme AAU1]KLE14623.1 GntR family transcriptional regulator [Clostridium sp. C8]